MANELSGLRSLTTHKMGFRIAVAAATIGIIYGYDLGAISGALLFIKDDFGLSTKQTEWVTTIVVAGSVLGALVGGRIANAIGRKPTMVIVALTYAVFAVLSGVASSVVFLDAARFGLGVTIGISIVTAPVFVAESAPAAVRGGMIVMYQVATVTGIVLAYFVDYALAGAEAWRWMLALSAVPSVAVVAVLARLPDTPRWYVMKGRHDDARRTLAKTDPEADADRELADIEQDLRGERGGSAGEMLRSPYLRATVFVVGLGFLIQITGINAVVFYSPMIFKEMGFTGNSSLLLLPALVQVGSLIATLVSLSVVDRLGRGPTLLTGIGAMIAATLLLVAVFASGGLTGTTGWLGFLGVFVFTAGFNFGFGSLVWGVRVGELPLAAALDRRVGDADREPRGEPGDRAVFSQRARVARRHGHVRDVRGAGRDRVRLRVVARPRDEGAAARGHPRVLGERRPLAGRHRAAGVRALRAQAGGGAGRDGALGRLDAAPRDERRHGRERVVEHHEVRVAAGGDAALAALEPDHRGGGRGRHRERVGERDPEPLVRVAHRGVHRQRAAGEAALGRLRAALGDADRGVTEAVVAVLEARRLDRVRDEHGPGPPLGTVQEAGRGGVDVQAVGDQLARHPRVAEHRG